MEKQAKIYIVATPLGNREDFSKRAKEILEQVDLIACEDTRRTGLFLQSLGISKRTLITYFDAIEEKRAKDLITRISEEQLTCALVTDAGTPAIADPGFRLVKLAHEFKIPVSPIPGPSALSAIVSVSGLASDRILFVGFLPRKKNQALDEIASWKKTKASIVAYESAERISESLKILAEYLPQAQICIGRELTKIYEEIHTFSIQEALIWAENHKTLKGELALMIDPCFPEEKKDNEEAWECLLEKADYLLKCGLSHKDVVGFFADSEFDKKELYQRILKKKSSIKD